MFAIASVALQMEEVVYERAKSICNDIDSDLEHAAPVDHPDGVRVIDKRGTGGEEIMTRKEFITSVTRSKEARQALVEFEKNGQSEIRNKWPTGLLDSADITSSEKVNNIENPKTTADRTALINCMMKGVPLESADIFVSVKLHAQVQIGA